MSASSALGLILSLAATPAPDGAVPAEADAPSPTRATPSGPEDAADAAAARDVDVDTDQPPPSAYDRRLAREAGGEEPAEPPPGEDFSVWGQLAQTAIALFIVVGLIYVFGRTILPRLAGIRLGGSSGRMLNVLERLQLDNRHALMVVRVGEDEGGIPQRTLLLSSGEGGVRLVTDLTEPAGDGDDAPRGEDFKQVLSRAARSQPQTPAEGSSDG